MKKAKKATKKATKKTVKRTPSKPKGKFAIELEVQGEVHKAHTDHIADFIMGLNVRYVTTKAVLNVTHKKKTVQRVFTVTQARRMFVNSVVAETVERDVVKLLDAR